jgi:hypothetical protein
MLDKTIAAMLIIVGIIHVLPFIGVLGPERLAALYGIAVDEPNLAILMRHRAVLFGIVGVFLLYAAIRPDLQVMALIAGFVSVISFFYLVWASGDHNAEINKVVLVDVVAFVALAIAAIAVAFR